MIDAVLSYHLNPATCGVAKFNHRLARELGVPIGTVPDFLTEYRHPLVSIKPSEVSPPICFRAMDGYDLFLHDSTVIDDPLITEATRVYAANPVIARAIREIRSDVIEAFCPSTIEGNPTRGTINVLTFGMAHKIQTTRYEKIKTLLDATGEDYTVSVSTAIHEGSPWDETAIVMDRLRPTFGPGNHLRTLGYLADDALARELKEATAVALFFDPALRANNTTFWAAMNARIPIITNLDADSPKVYVYDIDKMTTWPTELSPPYVEYEYDWWTLVHGVIRNRPCAK